MSAANSDHITISFPAGTGLSTIVKSTVTDTTAAATVGFCSFSNTTTLTCSLNTGQTIPAGHGVSIELDGVTNPPAGTVTLSVSTTQDMTPSPSAGYTIGAAGQPSQPTVAFSSPSGAAGARTIYTIGFTTSGTGALSNTANSQITINFPASTGLSTIVKSTVTDTTAAATVGFCSFSNTTTLTCSLNTGQTIPASHGISIELDGVTNPPAGTVNLSLATTSDLTTSTPTSYTIGAAGQPSQPTVAFSSPSGAAGARTIYTIGFTTSGTGALSNTANSQITINFPASTGLSTIVKSTVTDTTAAATVGFCSFSNTTTLTCSLNTGQTIPASHGISIELDGVTNPPAGTVNLSLATTSDLTTSTPTSYTIGAAGQPSQPTVAFSSPSGAAGARTIYTIGFTTSGTGALSNTANSQITINFPASTGLSTIVKSTVTDTTAAAAVGFCSFSNTTTLSCSLNTGQTIPAGHGVSIELDGVTNPPAGTVNLSLATTSDLTTSTPTGYTIGPAGHASQPSVTLTSVAPSAQGITYTIAFATSNTGTLSNAANSQIAINFPAGTGLSPITSSTVTDTTGAATVGFCSFSNTTTLTCSLNTGKSIPAGHSISIRLAGVTNPPNASASSTLSLQTTSDTTQATSSGYQGSSAPPPPAVTGVNPSSGPTSGDTSVTITGTNLSGATSVSFGSNGATNVNVLSSTQITATSPPGSGTVDVTVTTSGGTSATGPADRFTYNAPPPPPPPSSPPGVSGGAPMTKSSSGAAVSGSVNPENLTTTAFFQYGLDPAYRGPGASTTLYDQSTPVQQVGADSTTHTVTAPLSGLVPGALYHVRLVAINSAGTTFGVDQTFTTAAAPAPPPPVLGQTETAQPVTGTVFIRLPSGAFVKLTGAQQIPSGAQIDALQGSLQITTAAAQKGKTQQGVFGGAVFKLTQARAGATKGLATLTLLEAAFKGAPTYATCKKAKAGDASAAAASSKVLQLLHASAKGKFKTSGRYAAATVRGTKWTIADRCDGTLTHDVTDSVAVTDFVRHKTIILHAGQSYLAKATKHAK